jgi:hypothetical protein
MTWVQIMGPRLGAAWDSMPVLFSVEQVSIFVILLFINVRRLLRYASVSALMGLSYAP